ncbi:Alpha/Beta hydrolase protein [Cercophora newfieldiana]|uniref:Alpha/Beta hydrolase protein n=1 Tax=Cercophora newfieldiana TaxID=92897 RepID=A0AA40CYY3_9PEZI|nr:Alpha/Beta hydrolase protein [Cercophora newfieldiana]
MAGFVPPARLLSRKVHLIPGQLHVAELFFEVPKNYADPSAGTLKLFGRSVRKHEKPVTPLGVKELDALDKLPYLVYLEGGPGFGNREPQDSSLTRYVLNRGYQLLFLDYRGTGLSTPINAQHLRSLGGPQAQADYLKLFRADNNVRDCEAVRKCLTADFPDDRKKWSIFGQSFGGFVSLSYLSKFPLGLREVFMTGGLAPIRRTAEEVYRATYKKTIERNEAYYRKYPEDIENVHRVVEYLRKTKPVLPSGGVLTAQRFLSFGISFGAHGGLDSIHSLVLKLVADLDQFGFLTRSSLVATEQHNPFDTNPIYAILHEPIYCFTKGIASRWAASRVGAENENFLWTQDESHITKGKPIYFTGEMIFPFHFDTYPELAEIKEAANILAEFDGWDDLYDELQLRRNDVPVYAASFIDDMYVDFNLARETAGLVGSIAAYETNSMYHNAVRAKSGEVLDQLFRLRDDSLD